jgi:hypothetical protein
MRGPLLLFQYSLVNAVHYSSEANIPKYCTKKQTQPSPKAKCPEAEFMNAQFC